MVGSGLLGISMGEDKVSCRRESMAVMPTNTGFEKYILAGGICMIQVLIEW